MTDTDRILELLKERGSITSYELREMKFSGNPSERIRDLVKAGWDIESVRGSRLDATGKRRPMAVYTLRRSAKSVGPGNTDNGFKGAVDDLSGNTTTHSLVGPNSGLRAAQDKEPVGGVINASPTVPLPRVDGSRADDTSVAVSSGRCLNPYEYEAEWS